ncbi:hypothetical protein [Bacillus sp. FSL K6-3431]|uniref:hypothetical protein n=1 Tax=Bacillus sp. FSL K6-3431 TaxID=2921500 RepID=UPI0030FCA91A
MSIIKIDLQKPEIDFEIGGLEFKYSYADKSLVEESKQMDKILKEVESIEPEGEEGLEKSKEVLRKGYDLLLGDGAFDKIYPLNESCFDLAIILFKLRKSINDELDRRGEGYKATQQEKAKKYIQNKKKK